MAKDQFSRRKADTGVSLMHDPEHPGIILNEEFLKPFGLTVPKASKKLFLKNRELRCIIRGKEGISMLLAAKLSRLFGNSAQFWLNMQNSYDLWHVMKSEKKDLNKIKLIYQREE